jgi:hypothetical protein
MKSNLRKTILSGTCLLALLTFPANAAVVTIGYWRGGENDTPAPTGFQPLNSSTIDIAGSNNLQPWNSVQQTPGFSGFGPYYDAPGLVTGSTSTYAFDPGAGNLLQTSVFNTANSDWGIQAITTTTQADSTIIANGSANLGGYGIIIYNGKYSGLMNSIAVLEGNIAANGTARNVALVNDNGTLQLYVDGVLDVSSPLGGSLAPAGLFTIGGTFGNSGYSNFANGSIDEARIFTFATGEFNPATDLIYVVPEPSTSAFLLMGAVSALLLYRRQRVKA